MTTAMSIGGKGQVVLDNVHIDGRITNTETGISMGGDVRYSLSNSSFTEFSIPFEARQGTRGKVSNSYLDGHVADIAYEDDVILSIVNTYAQRLFNLTKGEISSVDTELNRIAHELIVTTDPSKIAALLVRLANFASNNEPQLKWVKDGIKWTTTLELLKEAGII